MRKFQLIVTGGGWTCLAIVLVAFWSPGADGHTTADAGPPACPGDVDNDGDVDVDDLVAVISGWGTCPACPPGLTNCGGECVDLQSDDDNCGICGSTCPPGTACVNGACQLQCPPGLTDCAGTCVDTQTDENNCGLCGSTCPPGTFCQNGQCVSCSTGK